MSNSTGKRIVIPSISPLNPSLTEFQVFTGGSGKAGRHVIPYLLSKGHKVLNLDLIPFPDTSADVYTLKTDLTDSGQVFNGLTSHFNMAGYESGPVPGAPDVVIHFAGSHFPSPPFSKMNKNANTNQSICTQYAGPRL